MKLARNSCLCYYLGHKGPHGPRFLKYIALIQSRFRLMDWTGYERLTSDMKKSTEKYTAAVIRRGARWVALASALIASCHSLNSMLKFSICFGFSGNSQSRSIPTKPRFRATSKALGFNKLNIISFVWTLACGFDGASKNRL
ncbi:hypothetical protein SLEP1_g40449 [Rubroshorea leprosula]|uniref:Uncharacterized protein n=1 Tax=Rubroshorea leprosula TaxID=152421 RepID=A0AAV5L3Q5_9ROSI|nr:hypothetical protein SLEP1_g40449 [Rubroshorea leprosula]